MQLFRGISVPHFSDNMDHADLNAAKVLKARANRSGLELPVEGELLDGALRSRKVGGKRRVPRRSRSQIPFSVGRV
jgi:hypothetical protein